MTVSMTDTPQPALRQLYESLGLQIGYHPGNRSIQLQITLADTAADATSQFCLVPRQEPQQAGDAAHGGSWPHE